MKFDKYYVGKSIQLILATSAIICYSLGEVKNTHINMVWIPVVFFLSVLILKNKRNYDFKNIAIIVIDVLATLKYAIIPILMFIYNDFNGGVLTGHVPSKYYIDKAIILQIIEIITVYIVMFLYKNKTKEESEIKVHKIGKVTIGFCILGMLMALIFWESFVPSQIFVIDSDYVSKQKIEAEFDGAVSIILNVFKAVILIIGIQYFYKKYKENNRTRYIIFSGLILLIYIALNTGTSRWAIVIPFITCSYLFLKMYGKKARTMILSIVSIVIVSVISITFVKFNWLLNEESSFKDLIEVYAKQMQEYFSGVRATAQGIEAIDIYDNQITFSTMINDFAGSIPVVSHNVNQKDRINIYYNYLLKGPNKTATQIMPMITIGFAYFYYPLCSIFILIHLLIAIKLGELVKTSQDIFKKYIYCIFVFWFSMCLGFNTQIIFGNVMALFIPFMILIKTDDILLKKRKT